MIPPHRPLEKPCAQSARAMWCLPLDVASTFRARRGDRTICARRGKGGWTWDIDGNGHVDHRLGCGPAIQGCGDDRVAWFLHDLGIIVEPDSREPWVPCEARGLDETCLTDTLRAVEQAVDLTLEYPMTAV